MAFYKIMRGLSVDEDWAEEEGRMQTADTQVNYTCRKKHLRYYFSGQEVSTFFSASL